MAMSDPMNPYASPQSVFGPFQLAEEPRGAWRDGDLLVLRRDGVLPDRCIKCNRPAEGYRQERKLNWVHPRWKVLFLLLIGSFMVLLFVRQQRIGWAEFGLSLLIFPTALVVA